MGGSLKKNGILIEMLNWMNNLRSIIRQVKTKKMKCCEKEDVKYWYISLIIVTPNLLPMLVVRTQ